jgi:4-alpha-glucanotransferase
MRKQSNSSQPEHKLKKESPITERGAGILLHITSLPSAFGIGDFGPEAKRFANFLHESGQKYWQLLPLNPTGKAQSYSPYSAMSSMAGNTLLISPEWFVDEGILTKNDIQKYKIGTSASVAFEKAARAKEKIFEKAYSSFNKRASAVLTTAFQQYCEQEAFWLDDFSLYITIKRMHKDKPWFQWPSSIKLREAESLQQVSREKADDIKKIKWLQFIFSKQWTELKTHCNNLDIKMFGDLPFYVSYDSADVWSNQHIFSLDDDGNMIGMAGVPPDYFNENGQLWGMPVFKWNVLKEVHYDWWIKRMKKNMELYDLVRLDHFRAFADYWEVPASEKTAINGRWKPGPGSDFFDVLYKETGRLPFVAEDLGEINDAVYSLRDAFALPGMKVLQFAFGDNMATSDHIPHQYEPNFIVYSGTHDNNTTLGWFHEGVGKDDLKRLTQYLGMRPNAKNIHKVLARLAYASVAKIAVLPMQDVLGLDEKARMNMPASTSKNWLWRIRPKEITKDVSKELKAWVSTFNR